MQKFLVGGAVRDEIMGQKSKDLDYCVVLTENEKGIIYQRNQSPFEFMANTLVDEGYKIFVETPEFFTVRAQTPDRKETADFVLARKEGPYSDGRRPDYVEAGTLEDDLSRRDFCFNAIAKETCPACEGNGTANIGVPSVCGLCDGLGIHYIDPFNGLADIDARLIRAVGDPFERLTEDALRAVRALRFAVTKNFAIEEQLSFYMQSAAVLDAIVDKISDERIQVELSKMFRYDTVDSISILNYYPALTEAMFAGNVSLDSTLKTKGRGK